MNLEYIKAKEKMLNNLSLDCQHFFAKNGYTLENGYCFLLKDKIGRAKEQFSKIKDIDIRAHWALFMISLIEGDIREYPTYFELRNFLEIDLNILIHYFKGDYVEKIIRYSDFMFSINPEIYKFIGRVLYNNKLQTQAMYFLNAAKNCFWNDPELHYQLAYIYYRENNFEKAQKSLEDCLHILPEYFPAINLLKQIEN